MDIIIKRRVVSFPVLPVIAGVVLLLLAFVTMRVARIQANEIGVFVNNLSGEIEVRTEPGATIYNGWITDFVTLDNTEQSYRMAGDSGIGDSVNIKTNTGADVKLDVTINYRLVGDASVIAARVIPECGIRRLSTVVGEQRGRLVTADVDAYKVKWIRDYARSVARYKFGELTPKEFYDTEKRTAKAREAAEELNALLHPHGIDVRLVVPENFLFYEELVTIINDKKAAEQDVEKQISLASAALEAQKREMTKAEAQKNVAIAATEGELKRAVLEVEAEAEKALKAADAYAYTRRTKADAEFYKASNDAQSILARAAAAADGTRALAASLAGPGAVNVVKMRYAESLASAAFRGVPYATDPRIQKVEIGNGGAQR